MKNPNQQPTIFSTNGRQWIAFLIVCMMMAASACAQRDGKAHKGVLDLRQHSWTKQGTANLSGEWAFYWNRLYTPSFLHSASPAPSAYATVPGFWNSVVPGAGFFTPAYGYATYRLRVLCPASTEPLQLKMLTVASAYKLFVNGTQLAEVGKVGTHPSASTPSYEPAIYDVSPAGNTLDIVIQVSNFNYSDGGLWDFITLGTEPQIQRLHIKNISADFFISGGFFLIGVFYFVIYFFNRRVLSTLYFGLFCVLLSMRLLVTGELGITYITNWSWQLVKQVEFLFLYLAVPVMALFSHALFPGEFSKKVLRLLLIVSVPFVAIVLCSEPHVFRYSLRPFQLFMLLSAFYGFYVYGKAVQNNRSGSFYFLAGFSIFFVIVINDILYTSLLIEGGNLFYAGLYILVICQAITLSRQFFEAFNKVRRLNMQLEHINSELNQKNDEINEANEQLSKLNAELDSLVFRTSHDLRSPITSVFAMADIIKMEPNAAKRSEYVEYQKKTLMRLNALITEILHYAKNKSIALQYEPIDVEEFVKHALQDHSFSYDSKNIERIVEVSQRCLFATDKAKLNMVLSNLISNGLKHHNKTQEHPYLKISAHITEQQAEIMVDDNGMGIDRLHLEHIFTKFYRINTSTTGSGFGLYIVKETIEKLGGTISVQSEQHAGTRFTIVVPNQASHITTAENKAEGEL